MLMYGIVQGGMEQLPRGRHRIPREDVVASQRRRLLAGIARALAEEGFARLTVEHVIAAAGVSRKTFYEHFKTREECLLAAYDAASEALWEAGKEAASAAGDWPAAVRAATGAAFEFLAADPDRARLFTVEARAAGEPLATRQRADVERAAALLGGGGETDHLPEATATTLVENVAAVVGANVLSGATEILPAQAPQLTEYLLTPYLGPERAKEAATLEPPAPKSAPEPAAAATNPRAA